MIDVRLEEEEKVIWDLYFAGIVSMAMHPGAGRSNGYGVAEARTLEECADVALKMIEIRREVQAQ